MVKKVVAIVVLGALLVGGGIVVWQGFRGLSRPHFDQVGGTEVVFEVADNPDQASLDDICSALRRRIDPADVVGVDVRPEGENRVAVRIPRSKVHNETLELLPDLVGRQGLLEFCIVANMRDDGAALDAAMATLMKAGKEELRRLEVRAELPPPPTRDGKNRFFPVELPDEPDRSYRWAEIGKAQLFSLELNQVALGKDPGRKAQVERSIGAGRAFLLRDWPVYGRDITSWVRRRPRDREQGKTREFFTLLREPEKGKAITGAGLARVAEGRDPQGGRALDVTFTPAVGDLFFDLTKRNEPTGDPGMGFYRRLAILFDGQILSAPRLNEPIRQHAQISGDFTEQQINDMVRVLRAGALPARLNPIPVSERTVEPRK